LSRERPRPSVRHITDEDAREGLSGLLEELAPSLQPEYIAATIAYVTPSPSA
jgi:hypothetical protein